MQANDNVEKTRQQVRDNILKMINVLVSTILIAECLREDGGDFAEITPVILMHFCEAILPQEAISRDFMDGLNMLSAWNGFYDILSKMECRNSLHLGMRLSTMGMFAHTARFLSGGLNVIYHSFNKP